MKVRIGIIGAGDILDSHVSAITVRTEFEIAGVSRRSGDLLSIIASRLGCRGFTDYRDLLGEKPDAVVVSLPHHLHRPVAVEALRAGCHVLVEQPMALTVVECAEMLETAAACGRHLLVAEPASFHPGVMLTGMKFRSGELGGFLTGSSINEQFYFHPGRSGWFLDPEKSGGGMFMNVGMHRLAVARSCLPGLTPELVCASVSRIRGYPVEACTSAIVTYREGGSMLYEETGYHPRPQWLNTGIHLIFEGGTVMWDDKTWGIVTHGGKPFEESLPPRKIPYEPVYMNLLRALRGEAYGPTAWEYAMDTAIAQAAYVSGSERRAVSLKEAGWTVPAPNRPSGKDAT